MHDARAGLGRFHWLVVVACNLRPTTIALMGTACGCRQRYRYIQSMGEAMKTQPHWDAMLTVRVPGAANADEVYRVIQAEVLGPLARLLNDEFGGCRIAGEGVTTTYHGRHAHVLINSTRPLPIIDSKTDLEGYRCIRQKLLRECSRKTPILTGGAGVVELTPILDQVAAGEYVVSHLTRNIDAQEMIFNLRQLQRLYRQLRVAA